jgi:hypothetical protein
MILLGKVKANSFLLMGKCMMDIGRIINSKINSLEF